MSARKYDPENRFDRAYMEHRQQTYGSPRRSTLDDRFECLRGDYVEPQSTRQWKRDEPSADRFDGFRTNISESKPASEKVYYMPSTNTSSPPKNTELKPMLPTRPPGLPSPLLRKKPLTLENDEQFPSLPSSPNLPKTPKTPNTPKTPKTPIEPLREEIEFIPLPKAHSVTNEEPEQLYRVIRKISGGSWSDRVKLFGPSEGGSKEETMNYDEDGFPMIREIEDMVNSFS
jgi:hypothetical protein